MRLSSVRHARPCRAFIPSKSRLLGAVLAVLAAGCGNKGGDPHRGAPPPPPPVTRPAACAAGGGRVADSASVAFFPQASGGFCLDPNGGEKTYGDGAALPLDGICDLFDGECEIYKGYGARRVVEARYVDGSGSPATIDVHLSKFGTSEGAYAMFTRRVVGDSDPAGGAAPRPIPGGRPAAAGLGAGQLRTGAHLAGLT